MDISLLRDFEELEGLNENDALGATDGPEEGEDDDPSFKPINAHSLQPADIQYELEKRGMKPTGFQNTDSEMLQKEFDKEFAANAEEARAKRKEAKRRAALQAGLQKRRERMEAALQEEQDEMANNMQVGMVLEMIKENLAGQSLRLDVNSVAARVLSKAMWANNTITCMDLSSNQLSDHAGSYLARILKRNSTLKKIELDNNYLGPKTCAAFGESLRTNDSLVYLSLDSNPLCGLIGEEGQGAGAGDSSGIQALSDALTVNKTLTSLNLWRASLTQEAGESLANAVQLNSTLLFCEVGGSLVTMADVKRIADKLDSNLAGFESNERARRKALVTDEQRRLDDEQRQTEERKKKELAEWLHSRREQRAEDRRLKEEDKIKEALAAAEEAARIAAQERKKAAEEKAAAEEKKKAAAKKK